MKEIKRIMIVALSLITGKSVVNVGWGRMAKTYIVGLNNSVYRIR